MKMIAPLLLSLVLPVYTQPACVVNFYGKTLFHSDCNIRPDSTQLISEMIQHFQENPDQPYCIETLDDTMETLDNLGLLHWFRFGQALIKKMYKDPAAIQLKELYDFIIIVNRQSNFKPERNKQKVFYMGDFANKESRRLTRKKIEILSENPMMFGIKDYFILGALPKGTIQKIDRK